MILGYGNVLFLSNRIVFIDGFIEISVIVLLTVLCSKNSIVDKIPLLSFVIQKYLLLLVCGHRIGHIPESLVFVMQRTTRPLFHLLQRAFSKHLYWDG